MRRLRLRWKEARLLNILLAGVGGQGTVLAAKILAQAAQNRGWHVRTAETIGMAQRGGSVVSHVRMGTAGEEACSPLVAKGTADMIIAFEPAEGARMLEYLAPKGSLVTATTAVQPVSAALSDNPYRGSRMIELLASAFGSEPDRLVIVPDVALLKRVGNRKALNTVMLASAIATGRLPLTADDLRSAVRACVKPQFVDLNLKAIDEVVK